MKYILPSNQCIKEALLIIALVFLIAGCRKAGPEGGSQGSRIRVAVLNGPSAMSIVKLMAQEKLEYHQVPVDFLIRGEPNQIKSMMFRHEADFAFLPSNMAAILYNMGFDYRLAAIPLWGSMYLVGEGDSLRSLRDLKGKRIYQMGRGVVPDVALNYLLREAGLIPGKDVLIDYSIPSHVELSNAVKAGIVKWAVLTEPQVSMIMKDKPKIRPVLDLAAAWNRVNGDSIPFAQTALVVSGFFSRTQPLLVQHFLEEYRKNIEWINSYPGEAASLAVKLNLLPDSSSARSSIPRCKMHYLSAGSARNGLRRYFEIFYQLNKDMIGGKLPDEEFYYEE